MLLVSDHTPLRILQGIGQTAGLRTVAAIGAASGVGVADVALAGVGHAQRAVDEVLDDGIGRHGGTHLGDLLKS